MVVVVVVVVVVAVVEYVAVVFVESSPAVRLGSWAGVIEGRSDGVSVCVTSDL